MIMKKNVNLLRWAPAGTVVLLFSHNHKIAGSIPAESFNKKIKSKNVLEHGPKLPLNWGPIIKKIIMLIDKAGVSRY
jgi:hypothetical protein